jgi:hypothetical protein
MGNRYYTGYFRNALFCLLSFAVLFGLPQLNPAFYPHVNEPSATYDCDDDTLDMYQYFERLGFDCMPVVGNLDMSGESYMESNHVWLLVNTGGKLIAYDWGKPRYDKQHYEGYKITLDYLIYAVWQDQRNPDLLGIASDESQY